MSHMTTWQLFLVSFEVRKELDLPVSLSSMFNLWQLMIADKQPAKDRYLATANFQLFNVSPEMQHAFSKKTLYEKVEHYAFQVNFLKELIKNNDVRNIKLPIFQDERTLEAQVIKNTGQLITWEKASMTLNVQRRQLTVNADVLNLRNYLMRDSKRMNKRAFVFEDITGFTRPPIVRIGFQEADYGNFREVLQKIMFQCEKQRLFREVKKSLEIRNGVRSRSLATLPLPAQQRLNVFKKLQENIRPPQILNNAQTLFENVNKKIKVRGRTFYLEQLFMLPKEKVIEGLRISGSKWNSVVMDSQIITRPDNNRVQIISQKCSFKDRTYYIQFQRVDQSSVKEGRLTYGRAQNSVPQNDGTNISFYKGLATVYSITDTQCKLYVEMEFDTGDTSNNEFAMAYLKSFSNIFEVVTQEEIDKARLFAATQALSQKRRSLMSGFGRRNQNPDIMSNKSNALEQTVYFSAKGEPQQIILDEVIPFNESPKFKPDKVQLYVEPKPERQSVLEQKRPLKQTSIEMIKEVPEEMMQTHISGNYLNSVDATMGGTLLANQSSAQAALNMQVVPVAPQRGKGYLNARHFWQAGPREPFRVVDRHVWEDDWAILKNEGVICTNEKILKEQKKIFGHVLKSLGSNILKSKSILNISLPVSIFKKQSHLRCIAANFVYAPILLEKSVNLDPLERMKYIIMFVISVGSTSISMEKPFNPILGETYQGLINNCPISLEQISHHPPISSYLFSGRGFKSYGAIEPKIDLGLNVGRGYSQRPHRIYYHDGTLIELSFIRQALHGLMMGDRVIKFQNKAFVYDPKNHLFGQLECGPRKKSFFGKSSEPNDFISGRIVRVSPAFQPYFRKGSSKAFPSKEHVTETLSMFECIWTDSIKFDGKHYFNFYKDHPCPLEEYPNALPSNSNIREDLVKFIEGDLTVAQAVKEKMQEQQRRDEKLREKYRKK